MDKLIKGNYLELLFRDKNYHLMKKAQIKMHSYQEEGKTFKKHWMLDFCKLQLAQRVMVGEHQ